jgi:hypothetical protein
MDDEECHDCGEDTCVCADALDEWSEDGEWGCYWPGRCLMAHCDHLKWECHTVEMVEAYEAECSASK